MSDKELNERTAEQIAKDLIKKYGDCVIGNSSTATCGACDGWSHENRIALLKRRSREFKSAACIRFNCVGAHSH